MSKAIKSTPERTHLGTMTERQSKLLLKYRLRLIELDRQTKEATAQYQDMIALCMPEGANVFDENTMSFFYEHARTEEAMGGGGPPAVPEGPPPELTEDDLPDED